jgi:hypothetical protein
MRVMCNSDAVWCQLMLVCCDIWNIEGMVPWTKPCFNVVNTFYSSLFYHMHSANTLLSVKKFSRFYVKVHFSYSLL